MEKLKIFIKTSLLGGISVILPLALFIIIFKWIYGLLAGAIQPLTDLVISRTHYQQVLADIIAVTLILGGCFLFGMIIKTRLGQWFQHHLETRLTRYIPGYKMIRTTVSQLFSKKSFIFSSVALVDIGDGQAQMTAFITDTHPDGRQTVFVPTGPNPTTGLILHLAGDRVHPVDISVEEAFRSVISCGAGSKPLLTALAKQMQAPAG